jgi:hypothetical protein
MAAWQRVLREMDLSEEKRGAVESVLKAHAQAVENWRKENGEKLRELRSKVREERREGDADEASEARSEMRKLWDSRRALQDDLMKQLGEHLTQEQLAQVRAAMIGRQRGAAARLGPLPAGARLTVLLGALRRVGLDEKQAAQVRAITDRANAALAKASQDIHALLTPDQKQKLEQMQRRFRERREGRLRDRARREGERVRRGDRDDEEDDD